MTPGDVARVLAKAAAFDQRTIGEADVAAWHEAVGDLDAADALAAVTRHYRQSRDRLWPADLRRHVEELDRERRRVAREQAELEAAQREAIGRRPARDRSEEIGALIAQLRAALPVSDTEVLRPRAAYWRREYRRWQRQQRAEPNPHHDPARAAAIAGRAELSTEETADAAPADR